MEKKLNKWDWWRIYRLFSGDYPQYCNENLPREIKRLRAEGRTGVEALIARDSFQKREMCKKKHKNN